MASEELDPVDKGILYLLQEDARNNTTSTIGEQVGVSSSTVANRIKKLEESGAITGYHPTIDYEQTGMGHHLLVVGTVPINDQEEIVDDLVSVPGVVSVSELLTNNANLSIELVGQNKQEIEKSISEMSELGVDIERMDMLKRIRALPYNHFGKKFTNEDDTG
ncbi:AsnC family transcriptional regulator [Halorubrum sp. JWXQ-INN 858]|uniref:Lrp/AsnC family transcriptional regulator n=1 Tax=Halorubrum sp. JWXQ-INN 858 TaxID=2690782 RepID=UPI001357F16F|nr:Lrp/AsnC family transcriptional regulator [Halorubrum sp. JWXQ-INN 858]MWV63713.1 AsnC family transcriptional regulator [Halorubrum sp. JWXQ-INN 858]